MKLKSMIACISAFVICSSYTVFADIPKDKIDTLSEHDKSTLAATLQITILTKKAGSTSSKYSDILGEDLSNYSLEELEEMRDYLSGPTNNGESESENETGNLIDAVICDYKLLKIKVTDAEIETHKYSGNVDLVLSVDIENGNDFDYEGYIDTVTVNGWQVDKLAWFNIKAGNKMKEDFTIRLNELSISSMDEIESFSISFKLLYAKYYAVTDTVELELK